MAYQFSKKGCFNCGICKFFLYCRSFFQSDVIQMVILLKIALLNSASATTVSSLVMNLPLARHLLLSLRSSVTCV